jgi:hypothetical protein
MEAATIELGYFFSLLQIIQLSQEDNERYMIDVKK